MGANVFPGNVIKYPHIQIIVDTYILDSRFTFIYQYVDDHHFNFDMWISSLILHNYEANRLINVFLPANLCAIIATITEIYKMTQMRMM